ncbi:hypothetical protein COCCADRAFT_100982 [Bipolaris zeicola 26-R-13]|uniref:Uncharacterized protein n=1 Tax=Cochliobolus carbonum (strain 26-R-13) TaxID=930089 RepID=W6Y0Q9_COCC2|nr:uncharacterized protein COCCADRAFT_100982 [Bipolaris zeicola 26-R-13]EUC31563.1 hypothetical protein COCCADRAFT_100982 [Bipolaris zeicola 26-R-13]
MKIRKREKKPLYPFFQTFLATCFKGPPPPKKRNRKKLGHVHIDHRGVPPPHASRDPGM